MEYIGGFVDSMNLVKCTKGEPAALFCLPADGTLNKAIAAVMTYAKAKPEDKALDISVFTNRALRAAFTGHHLSPKAP